MRTTGTCVSAACENHAPPLADNHALSSANLWLHVQFPNDNQCAESPGPGEGVDPRRFWIHPSIHGEDERPKTERRGFSAFPSRFLSPPPIFLAANGKQGRAAGNKRLTTCPEAALPYLSLTWQDPLLPKLRPQGSVN